MNARTETPLLAMRAGIYSEQPATGELDKLFRCSWSHTLPGDFQGSMIVVPDGCSDLIFAGGRLMIVGPDRTAAFPAVAAGETILGLRFRPGAALRWLDVPLNELVGKAIPLWDLNRDTQEIEEQLANESSLAGRRALLHAWALRKSVATADPRSDMEALFNGLSNGTLHDVSAQATFGERTLRRQSRDHFGYGPKMLQRILRFQRFLRLTRTSSSQSLAILALEAGYADQAHMTRDVKEFTTLTPQDIRRQLA